MSVIIDTTKSELEAVIRYARIGANNCMIANSWEVTDLVRCKDCSEYRKFATKTYELESDGHCLLNNFGVNAYDFCSDGERDTDDTH